MKKFLALLMAALMIVSVCALASCGGNKSKSLSENITEPTNPAVEEYVNANKDAVEMDDEEMSMKVYAKGNSVVFDCVLKTVNPSDVTDEVKEFADEMISEFGSLVELMQSECPEVESIIINYYDAKGGVILSKELK